MANYYLETCFCIRGNEDHLLWLTNLIDVYDSVAYGDPIHPDVEDDVKQILTDITRLFDEELSLGIGYRLGREGLVIWSDESFEVDLLCEILYRYMKHFDLDGYIRFGWAATASRPKVDAYGGGYAVITKKRVYHSPGMNHYNLIRRLELGWPRYLYENVRIKILNIAYSFRKRIKSLVIKE